jgi:hypothetical protein
MTFKFGRAYPNLRPLLPYTATNSSEDGLEKKCDPIGESTSLTSYPLLRQAGLNGSQVAQSTSGFRSDTLFCQDHEMLDGDILFCKIDIALPR